MRLLALQFTKCIANVNAFYGRRIQRASRQRTQRGVTCHVGNILPIARPDFGKVGLKAAENIGGMRRG